MRNPRYFVPDISPIDRPGLKNAAPRIVFVAESPHISEVEPEEQACRRPLCGMAGKVWWKKLGEVLEGKSSDDVSFARMEKLARDHRIAVINAAQFPMDPKVTAKYPECDPAKILGFAKAAGPFNYKKKENVSVEAAVSDLRKRLTHPSMKDAEIWPLGNDAEWFVARALSKEEYQTRVKGKIPHPSAWWRKGGFFGRDAQEKLEAIFKQT